MGELIGKKVIINEYAAFDALVKNPRYMEMAPRSKLIATYACCVSVLPLFQQASWL